MRRHALRSRRSGCTTRKKSTRASPRFLGSVGSSPRVGAPPDLVERAHRCAMQEIDHARRCFALAAGYGARSHDVEPMPDLLLGGLDVDDPLVTLAVESLEDGCLLEDFNADVAARCARGCEDAATRDVLERIVREEREHAEFSWDLLAWLWARYPDVLEAPLRGALRSLPQVARPTAASRRIRALVAARRPGRVAGPREDPRRRVGRVLDRSVGAHARARRADRGVLSGGRRSG